MMIEVPDIPESLTDDVTREKFRELCRLLLSRGLLDVASASIAELAAALYGDFTQASDAKERAAASRAYMSALSKAGLTVKPIALGKNKRPRGRLNVAELQDDVDLMSLLGTEPDEMEVTPTAFKGLRIVSAKVS